MEQDEPKRRHGGKRKKSLALKIEDRNRMLEQAQEKLMGFSITQLRRFLAVRKKQENEKERGAEDPGGTVVNTEQTNV